MSPKPSAKTSVVEPFVLIGKINLILFCTALLTVLANFLVFKALSGAGFEALGGVLLLDVLDFFLVGAGLIIAFIDAFVLSKWLLSGKKLLSSSSKLGLTFVILGFATFCSFGIYAIGLAKTVAH